MPHDVLDDDDGVVDDEADRDRQRHQRQIVEAVAELVEHREGADQRQRHGDGGNDRRPEIAQEQEDHHHHQCDGQHQRELHVGDRGADGLGAVGNDIDLDGGRDRGLELGSIALMRSTVSMTLAPGWRWTARRMARFWLNQPAISSFSPALMARPISRMRTGEPLR